MIELRSVILAHSKDFPVCESVRRSFEQMIACVREEVALCPHNTMYGLTWRASYGADREGLRGLFWVAVVALCSTLYIVSLSTVGR